jgi:CYTH domain-containing protein
MFMAKEIERKFLVAGDEWRKGIQGTHYRQGYLNSTKERCVRIRTINDKAFLTVKGLTVGCTRLEFEYPIPYADCVTMLDNLAEKPIIEKTRYKIDAGSGLTWEIDEFHGVNEGLIVAEIELPDESTPFVRPAWLGEEVSSDPRYFNSNLVANPYTTWKK